MNSVKGELQGCRANELLCFGCSKQHMHPLEKEVPLRLRGDFCINNSLSPGRSINSDTGLGKAKAGRQNWDTHPTRENHANTAHSHGA